jgi:hypothetical protein
MDDVIVKVLSFTLFIITTQLETSCLQAEYDAEPVVKYRNRNSILHGDFSHVCNDPDQVF